MEARLCNCGFEMGPPQSGTIKTKEEEKKTRFNVGRWELYRKLGTDAAQSEAN